MLHPLFLVLLFATMVQSLMMSPAEASGISSTLQSSMIWSPAAPVGTQAYVAFRKSFELTQVPTAAPLHLFADSRYMLWVNGRYVLRGPSRFHPLRPEYDTLDIASHLRTGRNVMVVLVHHYAGATSGRIIRHQPGLTALLLADGRDVLRSGVDWRSSAETEYLPSPSAWNSIPDVIDGRKHRGDWTATDFDDSAWLGSIAIDGAAWGGFRPRTTPLCREEELTGTRLMPEGTPLADCLPLELRSGETRPWSFPGGFSGTWMWTPEPAKRVRLKAVWNSAGFGVGQGSSMMIRCDNRFTLFHNGSEMARSEDVATGWTGSVDLADGDVLAIEAEDLENGDKSAGLFLSLIHI